MSRIARPENEEALLNLALNATANQVEQRVLRSRRRPADPGWVSRAKRRQWSQCGFGAAEEALAECRRA